MNTSLNLDKDHLTACISCGLCLPHCPTYQTTQDESRSPRGRISLMKGVENGLIPLSKEVVESMDTCVQCLGCETACPSGVQYGELIAQTREALSGHRKVSFQLRVGLWILLHTRILLVGSRVLAVLQRLKLVPAKALPVPSRIPLRRGRYVQHDDPEVILFTGCVMDVWLSQVHEAALSVLDSIGIRYMISGNQAGCCGALHSHAGFRSTAKKQALQVISALPTDLPILVDSAGCGAVLKEYGNLLGTEEAKIFSSRVYDIHEWLINDPKWRESLPLRRPGSKKVIVQDPCHLRHVQKAHESVRELLTPFVDCLELDDEGLCCGAGGAFSVDQPELAKDIRDKKLKSIQRAGGHLVVSANPGCMIHLESAGVEILHPIQVVAEYIDGRKDHE